MFVKGSEDLSDHSNYLSKKLWKFRTNSEFTDVTLVCADRTVKAHKAMFATILNCFNISPAIQLIDCLIVPDVFADDMETALDDLYSNFDHCKLYNLMGISDNIKLEIEYGNEIPEINPKIGDYNEEEEVEEGDQMEEMNVEEVCLKIEAYEENNENENDVIQKDVFIKPVKAGMANRKENSNQCEACSEIFKGAIELKTHLSTTVCGGKSEKEIQAIQANLEIMEEKIIENKKIWFCKMCDFRKSSKTIVLVHCTKHTKMFFNRCRHCEELFRDKVTLESHINIKHLGVKMFTCDCGVQFASKSGLKKHKLSHSEFQEKFTCHICNYITSDKNRLKCHVLRIHDNVKRFPCDVCGKPFFTSTEVKDHKSRLHSNKHDFQCHVCNKRYNEQKFLDQHIRAVHLTIDDEPQQCQECGGIFKGIQNLRKHIKHIHSPNEERTHVCFECGKGFFEKSKFERHMNSHAGVKNFSCSECGSSFSDDSALRRHLKIHEGTNKFGCDLCGKMFTQQYDVTRHKQKVHVDSIDD